MAGSKEQYITKGPSNGLYDYKRVPKEDEDIPAYVNDEFLNLGGIVNGIMEGGAFPPYAVMPKRWREGMIIFFSQPVLPDINAAGLWMYRDSKWFQMVDDPSTFQSIQTVYILGTETAPTPPSTGPALPPAGWSLTPPAKNLSVDVIWASVSSSFNAGTGDYTWAAASQWSSGANDGTDGNDGNDGNDGSDGAPGIPGNEGVDGIRGNINIVDPVFTNIWLDANAYNAVIAEVVGRNPAVPINGDTVTQQEDPASAVDPVYIETKSYQVGSGNPGIWELVELLIDGNLVVQGTISGEAIRSNSQIRIGGNAGQDLVVLDANDANARIWVGGSNGFDAVFKVDPDGNLFAKQGFFEGDTVAANVQGELMEGLSKPLSGSGAGTYSQILQVDITALPYDRSVLFFSGIGVFDASFTPQVNDYNLSFRADGVEFANQSNVDETGIISENVITLLLANTTTSFTVFAKSQGESWVPYFRNAIVQSWKQGGTMT